MMISEAVRYQFTLFKMAMVWGAGIVALYDVLRIFRRIIKHSRFFTYIEDIIFWIGAAFMIYHLMYINDSGAIRLYTMFGMCIGIILYSLLVSRFFVKMVSKILILIIDLILKPIFFIKRILVFLFRRFYTIFKKIHKFFVKGLKKIMKTVKIGNSSM